MMDCWWMCPLKTWIFDQAPFVGTVLELQQLVK